MSTGDTVAADRSAELKQSHAKRHVLIVDDDRDFADSLAAMIRPHGYQPAIAYTIEQARAAARALAPEVALLDIRLESASGFSLIEELRQFRADTLCIMITAYADLNSAVDAIQQGAYDYLRKPADPAAVFAALDRCFDRLHLQAEKSALEGQLRQAQKLEAVGRLAGGVAHDFNNVLTAILGNVELALIAVRTHLASPNPVEECLQQIEHSSQHAASLTRQLLMFSRRRPMELTSLHLNEVLVDAQHMLRRLLPENVEFEMPLHPSTGTIRADAGQIEQIVMNLVINAQDAMTGGGKLTVATGVEDIDEMRRSSNPDAQMGPHVVLTVSDTGCGMSQETLEHVFEPFFTTKEVDKGTGLGLATVYGIVKQFGGHILVQSAPGEGTVFRIYFPAETDPVEVIRPVLTCPEVSRGRGETILLCEDQPAVRDMLSSVLEASGYKVLSAENGQQALAMASKHDAVIAALVTDIVMPGMDGRALAEEMRRRHPGIGLILTSGYAGELTGSADIGTDALFLQKPYRPSQLLHHLHEMLSKSASSA